MRYTLLIPLGVLLPSLSATAAVIRVPEEYPSVLSGVDAAVAGDSVLVGPGTWTDREVRTIIYLGSPLVRHVAMVLRPGVTVVGTEGAEVTTLDGGPYVSHPIMTIVHATAGSEPARVVGFTVTGGGEGASAARASRLELVGCRLIDNQRNGVAGREQEFSLTDCELARNELGLPPASAVGGLFGIDVIVTCEGCTFAENVGPGLDVFASSGLNSVVLRDCVFRDHSRRGAVVRDAGVTIEGCLFLRNSTPPPSGAGGGLYLVGAGGSVRFSTFAYDTADGGGGASASFNYTAFENNTFVGCHARTLGGALTLGPGHTAVRNIFAYSTGRRGAVTGGPLAPASGCNLFWANADGDYFGDWVPAPTDIHADPLFCDPVILDFTLNASSPAAPANSPICGLIGAHGVGCGTVSLDRGSWGSIKNRYR